ncbi:MarR family winged helix-turn-helix transcriptional regulator [Cohnella faecalis]|uniref:MarR family transcriptional regulator n=1 Tax=Cohnella faecalis TaxID=2315694 RepID=A0A398CUA4_9BACL|nr:MarR family transcriptional regulator [Cohnella faecalis]RIE02851.1 MarR family transcriptional regulator [Cohnella faecalis]
MVDNEWSRLEEIDWLFRRMVRKFVKERDKIAIEGVALPGMLVLSKIVRDGEQKLGDLAEQLDLTSGAITALCDKLEEKGFATRRRMAEDRRTVLLDITDKGRSLLARNRNISQRSITLLFGGFTEQELDSQRAAYKQITDSLESFSETILKLAKENAERSEEREEPQIKPSANRFLNY